MTTPPVSARPHRLGVDDSRARWRRPTEAAWDVADATAAPTRVCSDPGAHK